MLATNRLNQSSPRPADTLDTGVRDGSRPVTAGAAPAAGESRLLFGVGACSIGGRRRRHENSGTAGVLVFRCRLKLFAGDEEDERRMRFSRAEMSQRPISLD